MNCGGVVDVSNLTHSTHSTHSPIHAYTPPILLPSPPSPPPSSPDTALAFNGGKSPWKSYADWYDLIHLKYVITWFIRCEIYKYIHTPPPSPSQTPISISSLTHTLIDTTHVILLKYKPISPPLFSHLRYNGVDTGAAAIHIDPRLPNGGGAVNNSRCAPFPY